MSSLQIWVLSAGAVLLALGSALFSAFETALFSLQPHEVERLRRKKTRVASALFQMLQNPRKLLGALVLGDVFMNVPLVLVCLFLLQSRKVPLLPAWASELLLLGLVVVICDLLPKIGAFLNPHRFVRIAVFVLAPVMPLLERPLSWMMRFSDAFAEWLLPGAPKGPRALSDGEMETLVEIGAEEGALHPTECAIIREIIRLGDKTVRDCMTPRVDVLCFSDDLSDVEITERLRKCRYRKVPIYGETPDEILGILDVRAFLETERAHYTEFLTPPSFVPETMSAVDLLRSFLRRPQVLAIVVDEHGGTEGVITRSDLVEEVLSEALPGGERELYIEELGDGRLVASGSARLEDISEVLGAEIECDGIDTIGGLAFNIAGALPKLGSVLFFDGWQLTVRRISRKRVVEVLVERSQRGDSKAVIA
jgi:CBS domain containing-hemolysin-like protein